jgi:hypothetical protein
MIDQTIKSRPVSSLGVAVCGGVAALGFAAAIALGSAHYALAALPAVALAMGFGLVRTPPFRGRVTDDALRVGDFETAIPYASIECVTMAGMPQVPAEANLKVGPLMVMHQEGVLEIPANLDVAVPLLYTHLLSKSANSGSREVNPQLAPVVSKEESTFGPDRVWTFRPRTHLGRRPSTRRGRVCSLLLLLVGVAWLVLPAFVFPKRGPDSMTPWIVGGVLLVLFSFLYWFILKVKQRHPDARLRGRQDAGLVVSPTGIAMIQGDVRGELTWDELSDVVLSPKMKAFQFSVTRRQPSLQLVVEGATIRVADIYDRPLPLIYSVIRRFWRGSE